MLSQKKSKYATASKNHDLRSQDDYETPYAAATVVKKRSSVASNGHLQPYHAQSSLNLNQRRLSALAGG